MTTRKRGRPGASEPAPEPRRAVVMLVKNSFEYDARVRKSATSLITAGWDVTVVALHVPGVTSLRERTPEGIGVVRVPRVYGRFAGVAGDSTTTPGAVGRRTAGGAPVVRRVARHLGPVLRAVNDLVVDRRMTRAALSLRPDVVHAHDLNTLRAASAVAARAPAHLVYDAHELHRARNGMRWWTGALNGRLEDRLVARADLVVTATDTWADILAGSARVRRPLVLRNVPERVEQVQPRDLRAWCGIPRDAAVLLYIGSVQRGRGIEELVAALPLLPGCHLVVVGYGAHLPALRQLAAERGLRERVHFPGPVENRHVASWSAGADVGACLIGATSLSYYTSLPNKLFDYLSAGTPVLASDFPEMGRVVRETGAGEVCEPSDPESIAAAVRRILEAPQEYRQRTREAGRRFAWQDEVRPLLDAYEGLAGRRP